MTLLPLGLASSSRGTTGTTERTSCTAAASASATATGPTAETAAGRSTCWCPAATAAGTEATASAATAGTVTATGAATAGTSTFGARRTTGHRTWIRPRWHTTGARTVDATRTGTAARTWTCRAASGCGSWAHGSRSWRRCRRVRVVSNSRRTRARLGASSAGRRCGRSRRIGRSSRCHRGLNRRSRFSGLACPRLRGCRCTRGRGRWLAWGRRLGWGGRRRRRTGPIWSRPSRSGRSRSGRCWTGRTGLCGTRCCCRLLRRGLLGLGCGGRIIALGE